MKLVTKKFEIMEQKVQALLQCFAKDDRAKNVIAPHVATISLRMNHLYQDLGFKSRVEMGRYMKEHFPALADQKPSDKLWKKYIYELIDETAPACVDCKDQINCFACKV
jgi:nitrogen fixation protein NifQ